MKIKVFLTVRNRLEITKKCIQSITKHSISSPEIYVYDNLTNFELDRHFSFFYSLMEKEIISSVVFNTKTSTFNAFSKAVSCNQFGHLHEDDPNKDSYSFLLFLDNDIILTPGWDRVLKLAWEDVKKYKISNIKIISQLPGGIKFTNPYNNKIANVEAKLGKLGGSGLWCVKSDFFRDVGFLPLREFVGHNKRHDQVYWRLIENKSKGQPYIAGLNYRLGFHCGSLVGSVCNILTKQKNNPKVDSLVKLEENEKSIKDMSFDEFYKLISNDPKYSRW